MSSFCHSPWPDVIVEKKDYHYKKSNCQGCDKTYSCRQSLWKHKQKCQTLRNKKDNEEDASGVNEKDSQTSTKAETIGQKLADVVQIALRNKNDNKGDGSDINVKDSQTTTIKSETTGQIVGKKNYYRKVYCRECGISMWSSNISRHRQKYCQVLGNKKNERAKKRKVDYLEESEFSGAKTLPSETLIGMMELLKNNVENQIHILKLGNKFYSNTKVYCQKCGKTYSSRQSLCRHKKKYCKGENDNTLHSISSQVESRVKETDLTSNISEIGAKKRKVDCLGESKDISTTFEKSELSGTKSLPSETLVEMIKDS